MSNNRNYWLKSGIINIAQSISTQVLSFGSFWFMARLLSKEDFGAWGIYLQALVVFELLRSGLVQSGVVKFVAGSEKDEHSKIFSAGFIISGALTVICIIVNLAFISFFTRIVNAPQLEPVFYLFNIVFILSGILTQLCCVEQANFQYQGVFLVNFIRQFALFIYPMYCFFFNKEVELVELVYVQILSMSICVVTSWLCVRKFFYFRYVFSLAWIKKIFNYGKYAFGTSLSSQLSGTIDQWMLAGMLSPASAASFNTAVRITNLTNVPTDAVSVIVFPQSARRMHTEGPEAIKYLYEKSVGTILAILIPTVVFIYLFDDWIVYMIASGKYADSVPILHITLLYCLLLPFGRQFGTILDSIGKTNLTFIIVVISASINLVLNFIFIKQYGVIGAAYATLISQIIGFVISQIILYKELKVNALNAFTYAYMFYPEFINKYVLRRESK